MTLAQLLLHLIDFVMPALMLAVLMPLAGHWVMGSACLAWPQRLLCHVAMGVVVLLIGLWVQGHDGRMSTYTMLVLSTASLEWVLHQGWRRQRAASFRRK